MAAPTSIDLFCGAGGLTSGLETVGWETVAAVDHDKHAMATLRDTQRAQLSIDDRPGRVYLEGTALIESDVAELTAADLRPSTARSDWRPDLLAGGPPCQPFSSAGKQRGVEDPRGRLFLDFVRIADELQPRFILFENVRGLVTAKTPDGVPGGVLRLIQDAFEDIGYACRFALLNAADYGAAQRRVRLFMFATADWALPEFPSPTHARDAEEQLLSDIKPWVTLREFLDAQPEPAPDDVVRPHPGKAAGLEALEPGTGLKTGGIVEANRPGGHWGYKQDSFLADPSVPSRTIRAASTPDWIRELNGRLRRLTWRECAGLQGFPRSWCFQGSVAARFRQIGNAVQGDVARVLGSTLRAALDSGGPSEPQSPPWPETFHKRVRYTAREHEVNGAHRAAQRQT